MVLKNLYKLVSTHKITHLTISPSVLNIIVNNRDFKFDQCLKHIYIGGEPLPPVVLNAFQTKFDIPIYNVLGLTETLCSILKETGTKSLPNCVGKPIADNQAMVIDEDGNPCKIDQPGRLIIKTSAQAREYFNDPVATAYTFRNGWVYTNDLVKIGNDGNFYYLGRLGLIQKIKSKWVNLLDIENLLYSLPELTDCRAEFTKSSNGEYTTSAYIVGKESLSASDILTQLNNVTRKKHLIPKNIFFVDNIPRTHTNKKIRHVNE
jgi:acyl-coenzyme A synthetase/AMP-(fatty) acid ligase